MRAFLMAISVAIASLFVGPGAELLHAQSFTVSPAAVAIEEEWEVVIADPDPDGDGPQIQTYMSPVADDSEPEPYFWLMLNSRDRPYNPGGMQVQAWTHQEDLLGSAAWGTAKLNTSNETITWRQRLTIVNNGGSKTLRYEIRNLQSTTWGSFGGPNGPAAIDIPTHFDRLSGYDPETSLRYSKVGWQANRVSSMTLKTHPAIRPRRQPDLHLPGQFPGPAGTLIERLLIQNRLPKTKPDTESLGSVVSG